MKLSIYNLLGQRVRVLVNEVQATGAYEVKWDGRNDNGLPLSSGVYVYRIKSGEFIATRKLLLIR